MITLAQRIEALRTERGLSRPASPRPWAFPKMRRKSSRPAARPPHPGAAGEDGRLFFGVSLFYLRGEQRPQPVRGDLDGRRLPG